MWRVGCVIVAVVCWHGVLAAQAPEAWVPIFNGTDLEGWRPPPENRWWLVREGALTARSGPEQQGSILWTARSYRDFAVQLDFRFVAGTVDSGVFLRNENEQIQVGISGSLQRDMTGSPYIASRSGYPVEAAGVAPLLKQEGWNRLRISAQGSQYVVWLNGEQVLSWRSETAVPSGPIGLQLHAGRDMAIDFRQILVAEL